MGIQRKIERLINAFTGTPIEGVLHYNWFKGTGEDWLVRFALHHFDPEQVREKIGIASVFGPRFVFKLRPWQKKIFFTGENTHRYQKFEDMELKRTDLSLGFDNIKADNYIRFPLWIMYVFDPTDDAKAIRQKVKAINAFHPVKKEFAALIAKKESTNGLRSEIYQALNEIAPVKCAGKLYHNDDSLWTDFNNKKIDYLHQFEFSVCPENTDSIGYVTEKLFEAFVAGTVPIYWGSDNNPEPGRVNKDGVVFWQPGGDNSKALDQITYLHAHKKAYDEFVRQERLTDACTDYVIERFELLKTHLARMLKED